MYKKLGISLVLALSLIGCGVSDSTFTGPLMVSAAESAVVTNSNVWETRDITWFGSCANQSFKSGSFDIHLQNHSSVGKDGVRKDQQHFNVAGGRLETWDGTEYVFGQNGKFIQYALPTGEYEAAVSTSFRLISKGSQTNEFVDLVLYIRWDGENLTVLSSGITNCRS